MTTKKDLQAEIEKLKRVIIDQKIAMQAVANKPWEGKQTRLLNFITFEKRPSEIWKFKNKLPSRLRNKVIQAAPIVEFDPKQLKTAQRNVIRRKLRKFDIAACNERHAHEHYGMIYGIVARCKRGYFIYDSNHRACINLLAGNKHRAHCIDLRDIDNIIARLKHDDKKKRS